MPLLISHRDMTTEQILNCSYQAQGIIATCVVALKNVEEGGNSAAAGDIGLALEVALELLVPVHDVMEVHEGKRP